MLAFIARADEKPPAAEALSKDAATWLLKVARSRLSGKPFEQQPPREAIESRRATLFITTFERGQLASRPARGTGDSLKSALDSALAAINQSEKRREHREPDRIQIDVLDGDLKPLDKPAHTGGDARQGLTASELLVVGVEGIAIETGDRVFYLLPSEMIYSLIFDEDPEEQRAGDLLNRAATYLGLNDPGWRSPTVKLSRFRTTSFVEDASHTAALQLTCGLSVLKEAGRERLHSAARSAGDYLVRMQRKDGSFNYSYDAREDRVGAQYNMVRHAGAALSLFDLYAATRDERYLNAARRAVGFLKTRFRPAKKKRAAYVLDDDGKAKLGANGLALLALTRQIELDPKSADRESAARLANLILQLQRKDGSFESYHSIQGGEPEASASLYYPGEAILGLAELYRLNGDRRLLNSARRGAEYLIQSERKMTPLPPDAWLIEALEALFNIDKAAARSTSYAEHAIALAEAMVAEQYTDGVPDCYSGGFRPGPPRATPAASRAEGMVAAYRLARSINDPRASKIASALKAAARFQLSQQFDADNSFFLPQPERAAGGFREGLTSMRIRIDYVQHNISSLLGIANSIY